MENVWNLKCSVKDKILLTKGKIHITCKKSRTLLDGNHSCSGEGIMGEFSSLWPKSSVSCPHGSYHIKITTIWSSMQTFCIDFTYKSKSTQQWVDKGQVLVRWSQVCTPSCSSQSMRVASKTIPLCPKPLLQPQVPCHQPHHSCDLKPDLSHLPGALQELKGKLFLDLWIQAYFCLSWHWPLPSHHNSQCKFSSSVLTSEPQITGPIAKSEMHLLLKI